MADLPRNDATRLILEVRNGNSVASDELFEQLYGELRRLAARLFRGQSPAHTLQPTALIHEAYLKLVRAEDVAWQDRAHFFNVAARAMRQILVNHARDRAAIKRGGGQERRRVTLSAEVARDSGSDVLDVLALQELLEELAGLNDRHARIVELKIFAGLENREIAEVIGVSLRTVEGEWRMARGWLASRLERGA